MTVPTLPTFSPVSEDGRWRLKSPDGLPYALFGRAPVPASHFPRLASEAAQTTLDTSGPTSSASSASAALQSSLGSKLHQAMAGLGSPEYVLTWKRWDMPLGPPICALRALAPRTSGSGSTGALKGWKTPIGNDATGSPHAYGKRREVILKLPGEANLAGWPTPTVGNAQGSQMAKDASATGKRPDGSKATVSINAVGKLAGWPTPAARDWKDGAECLNVPVNALLGRAVWGAKTGEYAILADPGGWHTAVMIDGVAYRLNPRFSLWLMGYPDEWASCGEQAMQSTHG